MKSFPLADLQRLRVTIADHIATVTMATPPVNAQDRTFREEIVRVFDWLSVEEAVRAVVLTGDGRTFSAGADLNERRDLDTEPGAQAAHNRLVRAMFDAVMDCAKPVIAAMNGPAIGGGAGLALVSDILVVAEDAYLAFTEVDYGLAGGARHALRAFSPSDARLMLYTAKRVTGRELYRMNVASACVAADALGATAMEIARTIAAKPPLAVEASKRAFGLTEEMSLRDGYRYEQTQTAALAESRAAIDEKRAPVFRDRATP